MDPATIGSLTGLLVPLGAFALAAVLVGIEQLAKHRSRELRHQTIRLALEKGQPLPAELLQEPEKPRRPRNDLAQGIVLVATGVGISLFMYLASLRFWAAGLIPVFIGIGKVVAHRLAPTPDPLPSAGAPPTRSPAP